MSNDIVRYEVKNEQLKRYVKFFWELKIDYVRLNHKLIPQRNINLRLNLSDTPHYMLREGKEYLLEKAYFTGLQSESLNAWLKLEGDVDVIGICFEPYGLYPFFHKPMCEFSNRIIGAGEAGCEEFVKIIEDLKTITDTESKIDLIEKELLMLHDSTFDVPDEFINIFKNFLNKSSVQISQFCNDNRVNLRRLERMYNRYVGLSANSYNLLQRFHSSASQVLYRDYSKLSDVAFDNEYYDQMHFIKDFKRFAGNSPGNFKNRDDSLLQIGKFR